jgi:hypothetical protein
MPISSHDMLPHGMAGDDLTGTRTSSQMTKLLQGCATSASRPTYVSASSARARMELSAGIKERTASCN